MQINCVGWDGGVKYIITSENDTENAVLMASVDSES